MSGAESQMCYKEVQNNVQLKLVLILIMKNQKTVLFLVIGKINIRI